MACVIALLLSGTAMADSSVTITFHLENDYIRTRFAACKVVFYVHTVDQANVDGPMMDFQVATIDVPAGAQDQTVTFNLPQYNCIHKISYVSVPNMGGAPATIGCCQSGTHTFSLSQQSGLSPVVRKWDGYVIQ
ncbi:MAG: hypothetical protein AB1921_05490 [Thermodesulfobacteriota bacterium]